MDSQAQLKRTHAHHQAEEPIRIHHPEVEEHHEKGPSKVLKKVKDKAKKIKKALTKHGHGHEHDHGEHIPDDHDLDEEDDEDDYDDQKILGDAPARGEAHIPVNEETVPPGTRVFPVVSSSHTKPSEPIRGVEPAVRGANSSHVGHEALSHPVRPSGVSEKEERRGAGNLTPHNTPVSLLCATEDVTRTFVPGEDKSRDQRRVNIEKPRGLVTPVYEKVKETGASVMTKLPFSGGGTGTETESQRMQDKGISAREYLKEKLSPGEEDKILSEVVAEKLHIGGGSENTTPAKKGIVTQSEEVEKRLGGFKDQRSEAETKHGEKFAEEGEGGMVEKLREAVTSWIAGTTDEVTQKSTESVQDSSQSIGSTVGKKMGFSGSGGGDEEGQRSDNSGSVPVQRRFQDSRK